MLVDVHTHLTHDKFKSDLGDVIRRAEQEGLGAIVCNGLEPNSNRQILAMAQEYPIVKAALGIYPIDAVNHILPDDFPHRVGRFDVRQEIKFIEECAQKGNLVAVGECGMDAHWLDAETFKEQSFVFESLIDIGIRCNLPIIVHSRKMEKESLELLASLGAKKVNMHCYSGKSKWALDYAEKYGWCFSIPANSRRSDSFGKLLRNLPLTSILTETDAPYLSPVPGVRCEPKDVSGTVAYLGELRGITFQEAESLIWGNYERLFFG
jgi:TatD DNase family protein